MATRFPKTWAAISGLGLIRDGPADLIQPAQIIQVGEAFVALEVSHGHLRGEINPEIQGDAADHFASRVTCERRQQESVQVLLRFLVVAEYAKADGVVSAPIWLELGVGGRAEEDRVDAVGHSPTPEHAAQGRFDHREWSTVRAGPADEFVRQRGPAVIPCQPAREPASVIRGDLWRAPKGARQELSPAEHEAAVDVALKCRDARQTDHGQVEPADVLTRRLRRPWIHADEAACLDDLDERVGVEAGLEEAARLRADHQEIAVPVEARADGQGQ